MYIVSNRGQQSRDNWNLIGVTIKFNDMEEATCFTSVWFLNIKISPLFMSWWPTHCGSGSFFLFLIVELLTNLREIHNVRKRSPVEAFLGPSRGASGLLKASQVFMCLLGSSQVFLGLLEASWNWNWNCLSSSQRQHKLGSLTSTSSTWMMK